jgi:hypothetical protein
MPCFFCTFIKVCRVFALFTVIFICPNHHLHNNNLLLGIQETAYMGSLLMEPALKSSMSLMKQDTYTLYMLKRV